MSTQEQASSAGSGGLVQNVWAIYDTPSSETTEFKSAPLGWMLGSAGLILCIVIGMAAYLAMKNSEDAMSDLLAEKGTSLLTVFESALRTGMKGKGGLRLQSLLEEVTRSPDIEFVAVTMPDGVILAHSNRGRIGENLKLENDLLDTDDLELLAPSATEKWKIMHIEGKRLFLLYRHFTLGNTNWAPDVPEPTIFVGMDISPFEITRSQNRSYVIMLCLVTMLVGLACLLAMGYARKASESRLRQQVAESEVQRLEKEVRRQEKMAAVGNLAAGVAHEIRNPLSSIKGYATYFLQRFPEGSDDREAAGVMLGEVNRLNRVITDLLGLSTQGKLKLAPVQLETVVNHVLRLLRQNAIERHIEIKCFLAPKIPPIMADMEKLSQALLNLCLNAFDAMDEGGILTVAVSGGEQRVCIIVEDNGKGIPKDIMSKIFDPYFTTKGTGTGLGLPMVNKIVTAHKGALDVASISIVDKQNGQTGTIFRIWLPVVCEE